MSNLLTWGEEAKAPEVSRAGQSRGRTLAQAPANPMSLTLEVTSEGVTQCYYQVACVSGALKWVAQSQRCRSGPMSAEKADSTKTFLVTKDFAGGEPEELAGYHPRLT